MSLGSKRRRALRSLTCLCAVLALAGCQLGSEREITSERPYADFIGARYSVVADDLYAYGVYESLNNRTLSYVELVPPPRIGGPEFAFRKTVPKGQVLRIVSAWRLSTLFSLVNVRVYYFVELEHSDLPQVFQLGCSFIAATRALART
jgi:hypothetical protein